MALSILQRWAATAAIFDYQEVSDEACVLIGRKWHAVNASVLLLSTKHVAADFSGIILFPLLNHIYKRDENKSASIPSVSILGLNDSLVL